MQKQPIRIKDKKIRIFKEDTLFHEGHNFAVKQYIHSYGTYLKAYVRQLSANERSNNLGLQDGSDIEFIINHRKVEIDMFIEFNGKLYQIAGVDEYEFYVGDLKLRAYAISDKKYDKVRWKQ